MHGARPVPQSLLREFRAARVVPFVAVRRSFAYSGRRASRPVLDGPCASLDRSTTSTSPAPSLEAHNPPTLSRDESAAKATRTRIHLPPDLDPAEAARRMRISQANKGKAAWNKGRKHSPETIARIKAATQAAMKRPEVDARIKAARFTRPAQTEETKVEWWYESLLVRAVVSVWPQLLHFSSHTRFLTKIPHHFSLQLKISLHAKAKMALIREVMRVEVGKLQEIMAQHPDEDLRTFAQGPHFFQDVMSLSWFMFRSDWARVSGAVAGFRMGGV